MTLRSSWMGALVVFVLTGTAVAQTPPPRLSFTHGSTLNLFAGGVAAPSRSGALGGGAFGWEVSPRWTIEGSGEWTEWGSHSRGYAAAMTALAGLGGGRSLMPFVTGGVGLYHASFARLGSAVPAFYRRRIGNSPDVATAAAFTDPTLVVGGGLNTYVNRHWAIRPDVRTMVVLRDSHSYVVTAFAVHVAYHFEDHPITPARR